ncbi:uncharacterized protein METZ01_LOCUS367372 [marine metagenome]|uniref:Uncharacterized protein n=1 Tax=marine metagenome TaxID=408172 RepID=A0A382SZD3_9ZZZZ
MIANLPVESWLLLIFAVGIGLGIEIFFFISQRKIRRQHLESETKKQRQ